MFPNYVACVLRCGCGAVRYLASRFGSPRSQDELVLKQPGEVVEIEPCGEAMSRSKAIDMICIRTVDRVILVSIRRNVYSLLCCRNSSA
jgi:hypothetical protein